jgi:hypothetical protein
MEVATFEARCAGCLEKFSYPDLGDFAYGSFVFTGERGNVHAYYEALGCPVWDFIAPVVESCLSGVAERDHGKWIQTTCAGVADPIDGQRLCRRHVCPLCQSSQWSYWQGQRTGSVHLPEVTFKGFLSLQEALRVATIEAFVRNTDPMIA